MCGQIPIANEEIISMNTVPIFSLCRLLPLLAVTVLMVVHFLNESSIFSLVLSSLYKLHALFIELMQFFYGSQIFQKVMIGFPEVSQNVSQFFWLPCRNDDAVHVIQTNKF